MTARCFKAGMACPPLEPGKLRIYGMRFCPYVHRALLVLQAKNISYEVVNIDLMNKPQWHFDLNPAGKVPILQQDGKVLYESLIVSEYLDEAYAVEKLLPEDPYLKAKDKLFIEAASAVMAPMGKLLYQDIKKEVWKETKAKLVLFEDELNARKTSFFSGVKPGFVDYMVWPFFVKLLIVPDIFPGFELPTSREFPRLVQWIEAMKKDGPVAALQLDRHLVEFTKSVREGKRNYDVGL